MVCCADTPRIANFIGLATSMAPAPALSSTLIEEALNTERLRIIVNNCKEYVSTITGFASALIVTRPGSHSSPQPCVNICSLGDRTRQGVLHQRQIAPSSSASFFSDPSCFNRASCSRRTLSLIASTVPKAIPVSSAERQRYPSRRSYRGCRTTIFRAATA